MYRIYCDDKTLHDVRDEEYQLITPKISLELNKTGSFEFGILPSHPHVNDIKKLKSRLKVYDVDISDSGEASRLLYCGRSITDQRDFEYTGRITCEGELSYLLDTIQRPHTYGSQSGEIHKADTNIAIFKRLIEEHNSQVEKEKQFEIGIVDIDSVEIKTLATNYETTWDFINTNFLEKYEGYLRVRYENNVRYLDYVKQYGKVSTKVIRFGENLLDFQKYVKAEDIKTAIIPIGANNVTIKTASGHDGKDYVFNQEAVNLYGWIYSKVDFSDITDPNTLLEKAQEYLKKSINLAITIELTAVDLHMVDVDIDSIGLGDFIPCVSQYHGLLSTLGDVSTYYLVSKYEIDLENPANTKITLGKTLSVLSEKMASNANLKSDIRTVASSMEGIKGTSKEAYDKSVEAMKVAQGITFDTIYPIGSIYMSINDTNPEKLFGGTWAAWGTGRVPVGVDTSDSDFSTVEKTGGEKTHKLSTDELASHKHSTTVNITEKQLIGTVHNFAGQGADWGPGNTVTGICSALGDDRAFYPSGTSKTTKYKDGFKIDATHSHTASATMENAGGGNAHNNMQPYITCYMWKRIE